MRASFFRLCRLLLAFTILLAVACMIPIPPPKLETYDPPLVTGERCTVTVIKESQWIGGAIKFVYVTLDGTNVARLESGEYTDFWVEPGHHTIGLRWRIGKIAIIAPLAIREVGTMPELSKTVELECRSAKNYFFGNRLKWWAWSDVDRMEFEPLTDLGENFRLDDKTYVRPGK